MATFFVLLHFLALRDRPLRLPGIEDPSQFELEESALFIFRVTGRAPNLFFPKKFEWFLT